MKYKSSYDTTVIIVSGCIISLTLYFFYIELTAFSGLQEKNGLFSILYNFKCTLLLLALLLISYCLSVKSYLLTDTALIINKRLGTKKIALSEVEAIERVFYVNAYLRVFGIGGLFGYNGVFLSTTSKIIYLYTNHKGNLVKINLRNKYAIYISPDDAEKFVEGCVNRKVRVVNAGK